MENNIQSALILLVVGMLTVFLILTLVVVTGNVLIRLVNRFATEEVKAVKKKVAAGLQKQLNPKTLAAITAAVEIATGGKGKIVKIEKK
ncbi:MAG: OadG family protein [Saprospiraceae bacterium]|nr:OadG family protein [Saprospiraceae bacterium]